MNRSSLVCLAAWIAVVGCDSGANPCETLRACCADAPEAARGGCEAVANAQQAAACESTVMTATSQGWCSGSEDAGMAEPPHPECGAAARCCDEVTGVFGRDMCGDPDIATYSDREYCAAVKADFRTRWPDLVSEYGDPQPEVPTSCR